MAKTIDSQIIEIERRLLRMNHGGLGEATRSKPRLDTSKPNFHDNKADFIAEMSKVQEAMAAVETLLELIAKSYEGNPDADAPEVILRDHIDDKAASRTSEIELDSLVSLLRRNAGDVGLSLTLGALLFDYRRGLRSRYIELLDQEREFWSGNSRPPNHYARTIAIRLARLVAKETGQKPTFGTSRDGGHPSTEFGRALEEVFELLEIRASVRHPAVWAINQLTDADTTKEIKASMRGLGPISMGVFRDDDERSKFFAKDDEN